MVRWIASQGKIARSFSLGLGVDFVEALVQFDAAFNAHEREARSVSIALPDEDQAPIPHGAAERWFGIVAAAVVSIGPNYATNVREWIEWLKLGGDHSGLITMLEKLLHADADADADADEEEELRRVLRSSSNAPIVRCGAAVKLTGKSISVEERLDLHGYLVSAVVSDGSYLCQMVFNLNLAKRIAADWQVACESPFNFRNPRLALPQLSEAIQSVQQGRGTLKTIMNAALAAQGLSLPEFMSRVW